MKFLTIYLEINDVEKCLTSLLRFQFFGSLFVLYEAFLVNEDVHLDYDRETAMWVIRELMRVVVKFVDVNFNKKIKFSLFPNF